MIAQPTLRSVPAAHDPDRFAVLGPAGAIGAFSLRGLHVHPTGRQIAAAIGGPRQLRFPGPHGIVDDLAFVGASGLDHLEDMFVAIARRSLARLYGTIFFCAPDRRVADILRGLGVELPHDLADSGIAPVVGAYQPGRADHLAHLRALELARGPLAAAA